MFHKTSSRLWWYYGQAYSISFHNKLKSIQYDNALALKHNFPSAMGVLVMGVDDFEMGGGGGGLVPLYRLCLKVLLLLVFITFGSLI